MQKQAAEKGGSFEEEEVHEEEKDLNRSSYFFVEAKNLERHREFHKAYELYKGAWKYDPHSEYLTELLREYAVKLHKAGDALYFITEGQALSELPDSTVRQVIGVYDRMDNYQQMIFAFEEIDSLSFYDSLLYVNALENSGHYMQAVEMYKGIQRSETVDSLLASEEEFSSMDKRDFYIQIGDLYAKNEMYDSALVYYDSVPEDSPLRLPAKRGRALALYEQGEYVDSAVQLMESVHDMSVNKNVFYPVLTEVLARHYAYEENDFIRGIEILTPLYEYVKDRETTSLILYYGKLISLFMNVEELYDESIPLLNELCEYDSTNYTVHLYRGISYTYSGDIDSAQKAFERAIKLSEDDYSRIFTVYRYAIIGSVDMDTVSVAKDYMDEFKESYSDSAATYYLLGKASNRMDEYAQALDYLDTAQLRMEQVTWELQFQKAIAYDNLNNFEQAEGLLQDIIASDSANHLASNYLGYSWVDRGVNLPQAKELIENALKQRPNSAAYLDSYAWAHYRLGEPENALKFINKALEKSQSDYLLFYHKADILKRLEKFDTAVQYYKKALSFTNKISDGDRETIQRHLNELQGHN